MGIGNHSYRQLSGHLPINFAIRHFPATYLSVLVQVSVVTAARLAFFYFGEVPSWLQVVDSLIIMLGVTMVTQQK